MLKRLGSFFGAMPSVAPSGVNSGDSDAARRPLRFVGFLLGELFLLRLEREANKLELKMVGGEEAVSRRSLASSVLVLHGGYRLVAGILWHKARTFPGFRFDLLLFPVRFCAQR